MSSASQRQIQALFRVLREGIDSTGWGGWVPDEKLMKYATDGANVVMANAPAPVVGAGQHHGEKK